MKEHSFYRRCLSCMDKFYTNYPFQKYCSKDKCNKRRNCNNQKIYIKSIHGQLYLKKYQRKNHKRLRNNFKEWYNKNKEHQIKNLYRDYRKNKIKWHSRARTHQLIKEGVIKLKNKGNIFNRDMEIHHEIYPTKKWDIIDAVNKGKIYFINKKSHKKIHSKEN